MFDFYKSLASRKSEKHDGVTKEVWNGNIPVII